MRKFILTACLAIVTAMPVRAGEGAGYVTLPYDGTFEDAASSVENAIIGAGLKVDYVSHVGEMLTRTGLDVGSDVVLFDDARIFVFCSASLSRRVMEADPMNVAYCPYGIFVAGRAGEVVIGYREYPEGIMQEVEALLHSIAEEAAAF